MSLLSPLYDFRCLANRIGKSDFGSATDYLRLESILLKLGFHLGIPILKVSGNNLWSVAIVFQILRSHWKSDPRYFQNSSMFNRNYGNSSRRSGYNHGIAMLLNELPNGNPFQ